jgi:hypothetical protein
MENLEIIEIAESVRRTSHRVKNSGDIEFARLGLNLSKKIIRQPTIMKAKDIEKEYIRILKNKYLPKLPSDKQIATITSMAGYDDSSNTNTPVESPTEIDKTQDPNVNTPITTETNSPVDDGGIIDVKTPNDTGNDVNSPISNETPPEGTYIMVAENLSNDILVPQNHEVNQVLLEENEKMVASNQIDYTEILHSEGQKLDGYVPLDNNGNPLDRSGVTIGTGVDIGQMSKEEIKSLDISQELKDKLSDYAGVTKQDALNLLKESPLNVTLEEAQQLDSAIQEKMANALINSYNKSSSNLNFSALPSEIQTAIASVSHQYGDLGTSCPNFWSAITEHRWDDAENELRNFGDKYPSRRESEANLFHKGIEKINSKK